ncbi:MAG: sulfatase, partial [Myxococcota bacterium]
MARLVLISCLASCSDDLAELRAPNMNVLLITIDTLRADHLGSYGYSRDLTPNLDAIAEKGVLFEQAFSHRGLTFPSVASIMTSKYVYTHGVIGMYKTELPASHDTLAEVMRGAGYRTAGFTSHAALSPSVGFAQGFDDFSVRHSDHEDRLLQQARDWLEENQQERFFLWLHSFGAHSPYQPPPEWQQRFTKPDYAGAYDGDQAQLYEIGRKQELSAEDEYHIKALYDGKVAYVDELIGGLIGQLDALGLRESTLVVATADHGEELFDHFFYFSHEASAYDGVLRVPLLMSLPGHLPEGVVIRDKVVESVDIVPTILDVVEVKPREGMQGRSLLPLLAGLDDEGHEYAYGSIDHRVEPKSILTLRTPRWRYIHNPGKYIPGAHLSYKVEELYDLREDPEQQRNVVED